METLVLTCKMCGTEFTYVKKKKLGQLPRYCSDACRAKAQKQAQKKYMENCKDKKAAKSRLKKMIKEQNTPKIAEDSTEFLQVIPEEQRTEMSEPIVTTNIDNMIAYEREVLPEADEMTMKVLDFAMRLGQLKFEGHEILNELSQETSEQDKQGQKFLHLVEAMDKVTVEQMRQIWKEEADSRTNRRDTKVLYEIVNRMIYNIPQNPQKFARDKIQNKEKTNATYAEKYASTGETTNDN